MKNCSAYGLKLFTAEFNCLSEQCTQEQSFGGSTILLENNFGGSSNDWDKHVGESNISGAKFF